MASKKQMAQSINSRGQGTSVIFMEDKAKFTDMAKFIKRLGDESVSCLLELDVEELRVHDDKA